MPYHVYTRSGPSAFGVIVERARDAVAKALALDEQAVDTAAHGPVNASRVRTYSAAENVLCVRR